MQITKHAYDKAKERLSWSKKALGRMALKAMNEGMSHTEAHGRLERYITKLYLTHKAANNIRIYGQNLYFFRGTTLITLYRVPNSLVKYTKKKG